MLVHNCCPRKSFLSQEKGEGQGKLQEVERTTFDQSCVEIRPDDLVVKLGLNEV